MSGPVCLVTGAGGGIGRASVAALMDNGWRIAATDRPGSECAEGDALAFFPADLADPAAPEAVVAAALARFGRLDGLLHCAGTSHVAAFPEQDDEGWDRVIDINLSAAHRVARAVGRHLIAQGTGGAVVMISSLAWMSGGANPAYGAAKGGVNTLVFNMAQALGPHGVRVNSIAPGIIATDMVRGAFPGEKFGRLERAASARTPLRRLGRAGDVADVAAFLMSERAGFVTGTVIPVTGGLELVPPIGNIEGS
ncbi:SDR family NAD(P)-dependent oxidoreductase [Oceanicella sp. SM1341]|uniref:SDR family NAD(P)-dependent oxidoreductase n=1 Tax=Oceanicella sp. SM1341 TaxID=1548889 RepID=UPI000E479A28|nr:SDR family NAD(P)-dependent oxidoreductase [Oceanicella sp. SM1341]